MSHFITQLESVHPEPLDRARRTEADRDQEFILHILPDLTRAPRFVRALRRYYEGSNDTFNEEVNRAATEIREEVAERTPNKLTEALANRGYSL